MPARPTVRCLREDLGLPVPPARIPLDEIDHPLLRKAQEQFAAGDTPHERIRAIDDVVLFKVKTGRWRGAVYSGDPEAEVKEWLVAGGTRAAHLLPGPDDHDRYLIEAATRLARRLNTAVRELVRGSLRDGHEHAADFAGFRLGIIVRRRRPRNLRGDPDHRLGAREPDNHHPEPRTRMHSRRVVPRIRTPGTRTAPSRTGMVQHHGSEGSGTATRRTALTSDTNTAADDPERIAIREALAFGKAPYDIERIEEGGTEPTVLLLLLAAALNATVHLTTGNDLGSVTFQILAT